MKVIRRASAGINGNLVLHIKKGDAILIDGGISILIKNIVTRNRVEVLISAPKTTKVRRKNFEERDTIQTKDPKDT